MQASVSKYTGQATAAAAVSVTEETPGVPESNPSKRRMRKSQCVKELKVFLLSYLVSVSTLAPRSTFSSHGHRPP